MFRRRAQDRRHRQRSLGQVVVEMILILPVFLTLVFTIMEMGHIAFWMIVLNHATYEAARIGALLAGPKPGMNTNITDVNGKMQDIMSRIIKTAVVQSKRESTVYDRQAGAQNYDLLVTGSYDVKLVFPTSALILAKPPRSGARRISATMRMPIELPLSK